ncbi:MAG: 3-isopropylmalate dehydratase small subunit [Actinomycetia bacterium]|nr:3-isopropylmalate dehydratase small subunit [Actinomycetes bacterium]
MVGDNVDTDVIAPAEYLLAAEASAEGMETLKRHAFQAVYPGFHEAVRPGDILVAGKNFGLGSHREGANLVLKAFGIQAVVAESIARIFFRNAIALGMPAVALPGVTASVGPGDELELDLEAGRLVNRSRGTTLTFAPLGGPIPEILAAGGLLPLVRRRLAETMRVKMGTRE